MEHTENTIFTNMCMIYDDAGNVVVQNRTKSWCGYAFPGGHVEPGESFTDAMIREVFEETNLKISNLRLCGIKDSVRDDKTRYIVFLYKTNCFEGELHSSDEGEVRWVNLNELKNLKLSNTFDTMLEIFLRDELTEQYWYRANNDWVCVHK